MDEFFDIPAFSRNGETLPEGKSSTELKTWIPEIVAEDFTALAVMKGKRPSEYLREVVMRHLYGEFETARSKVTGEPVKR